MMAAMMLPGLIPLTLRRAPTRRRPLDLSRYLGSYLTVWAAVGVIIYILYRPHSVATAGLIALAAGLYELTPLKRHFRRSCHDEVLPGWQLGLCCVGSSIGLMLVMVAFGVMSVAWMAAASVAMVAQKLLPPRAAVDVALAIAIVALGLIELAR
jgi:predicted metal-binding membrane protein